MIRRSNMQVKSCLKLSFLFLFMICFRMQSTAATGDTTIVHGFDHFLHQNCNTGDSTFIFPDTSHHHYKILLKYNLSCPAVGCDIYDRIATLKVLKHTGVPDSTLTVYPSYKVNGAIIPSYSYMYDTSWTYHYDTLAAQIDSTPIAQQQVIFYGDSL